MFLFLCPIGGFSIWFVLHAETGEECRGPLVASFMVRSETLLGAFHGDYCKFPEAAAAGVTQASQIYRGCIVRFQRMRQTGCPCSPAMDTRFEHRGKAVFLVPS